MVSKSKFLLGLCAVLVAAPAMAGVKDGVDAWSRGDYPAAVRAWKEPAAQGDADAQFNMAQAYKLGRGVPQDLAKAEKLFEQAAAQGHLQAADNFGLLLFQRGERARAMPFIQAASGRGDPRAHYVLGLAHFNGDGVPRDWERAYALVSLAQQSGLPQAGGVLARMDEYIPLEQRQRGVALAARIAANAEATRQRQVAAADLGVTGPGAPARPQANLQPFKPNDATGDAHARGPGVAGADYTHAGVPPIASIMREPPTSAPTTRPAPPQSALVIPDANAPLPVRRPQPVPAPARPAALGAWRVQLGAFGVPANADGLWNRVKSRPELSGHGRLNVPAGRVVKLQAGGFADQSSAQAACGRLKAGGFDCIAVRD